MRPRDGRHRGLSWSDGEARAAELCEPLWGSRVSFYRGTMGAGVEETARWYSERLLSKGRRAYPVHRHGSRDTRWQFTLGWSHVCSDSVR